MEKTRLSMPSVVSSLETKVEYVVKYLPFARSYYKEDEPMEHHWKTKTFDSLRDTETFIDGLRDSSLSWSCQQHFIHIIPLYADPRSGRF